jgi:hypothetical protein
VLDESKLAIERWENEGGRSLLQKAPSSSGDTEAIVAVPMLVHTRDICIEGGASLRRGAKLAAMPGELPDTPGIHSLTPEVCDLPQNRLLGNGNIRAPRRGPTTRYRDDWAWQLA